MWSATLPVASLLLIVNLGQKTTPTRPHCKRANTTWTVRLTVKVTAPSGTVITESAATMATTPDPYLANNKATVNLTVGTVVP